MGALIGCGAFFFVFPFELLDVTHWQWLMRLDPATQFLGWHFFRNESWHIPLGAATKYGQEMGSSIVFTDSIPLLALALKPFSTWLPAYFQYFGWWLLACYALAGYFAWRLAWELTGTIAGAVLLSCFAVANPVMLDRAIGHYALVGHFLVLWALLNYVRSGAHWSQKAMPLWFAAFVHAYLLLIVLTIWISGLVKDTWIERRTNLAGAAAVGVKTIVGLLLCLWFAGYFELIGSVSGGVYGQFAANLNGFWNPQWGSRYLPPLGVLPSSALEGYIYLGLGVILLIPVATYLFLKSSDWRRLTMAAAPLAIAASALFAIALSNEIYWGDRLIFSVKLPAIALQFLSTFRASGRLAWLAYYCIVVATVTIVIRFAPRKIGIWLVIAALGIQLSDLYPRYLGLKQYFFDNYVLLKSMQAVALSAPEWELFPNHYKRILVIPMQHVAPNYLRLGLYAADHRMSINVGYFARINVARVVARANELLADVKKGQLDDGALYILNDRTILPDIKLRPNDALLNLDGMIVLAPGWRK